MLAHRGASATAPENTIASFLRARYLGADGIELDVSLSRDDVPVVIHDATVDRTTDGHGAVRRGTVPELAEFIVSPATNPALPQQHAGVAVTRGNGRDPGQHVGREGTGLPPSHAGAALVAYPELSCFPNRPRQVWGRWGINADIFNPSDRTVAFLQDVLREVMELFPSKFIHVGGDEAIKDYWKESPRVQERIRHLNYFIAENPKTARALLKLIGPGLPLQAIRIERLDQNTAASSIDFLLQPVLAGSDAGLKMWLNGKLVHSANVIRRAVAGDDRVPVQMQKGWNTLIVKLEQGDGPWRVCVRVRAADGGKLEGIQISATQQ